MGSQQDLKILLAEDNRINQRIAEFIFRQLGVTCDIASNGEEAVQLHLQRQYDLVLMDLQMPVLDGLEATRKIRALEKGAENKHRAFIVALTANDVSEKREVCIEAGMDDFMEKPLKEDMLLKLFSQSYK